MTDFYRDFLSYNPGQPDPYGRAYSPLTRGDADNYDHFYSATRAFQLTLQSDGNFVLYVLDDSDLPPNLPGPVMQGNYRHALWASNTVGTNGRSWLLQGDGNLVVYDDLNGKGAAVWASGTQGNPGAFLRLQDDGNLVIYRQDGSVAWATNTYAGPH